MVDVEIDDSGEIFRLTFYAAGSIFPLTHFPLEASHDRSHDGP